MHKCCKGQEPCIGCIDSSEKIKSWYGKSTIVCHHQTEMCKLQFLDFGLTKYCRCPIHEQMLLPLERSEINGSGCSSGWSSGKGISP